MTENTAIIKIIDEITACRNITLEQLHMLLETDDMQAVDYLRKRASEKAHETYGNQVFIRGLIEFTNYCKKRLSLLRYKAQQYPCGPLPPEYGADYGMLRERL